ncbi:unnamed protein product [Mesocestoides corti]|uniref:Uncharacterized protein n=2 Tax=Mesocestoides corti TaxID=53468 RepID=A0A0R3U9Z0_MESCO|nr:unnamed protein product [Mesocestoides corti]
MGQAASSNRRGKRGSKKCVKANFNCIKGGNKMPVSGGGDICNESCVGHREHTPLPLTDHYKSIKTVMCDCARGPPTEGDTNEALVDTISPYCVQSRVKAVGSGVLTTDHVYDEVYESSSHIYDEVYDSNSLSSVERVYDNLYESNCLSCHSYHSQVGGIDADSPRSNVRATRHTDRSPPEAYWDHVSHE